MLLCRSQVKSYCYDDYASSDCFESHSILHTVWACLQNLDLSCFDLNDCFFSSFVFFSFLLFFFLPLLFTEGTRFFSRLNFAVTWAAVSFNGIQTSYQMLMRQNCHQANLGTIINRSKIFTFYLCCS